MSVNKRNVEKFEHIIHLVIHDSHHRLPGGEIMARVQDLIRDKNSTLLFSKFY